MKRGSSGGHRVRRAVALCTVTLVMALVPTGCVLVGSRSSGGWDRAPQGLADDWRDVNMQDFMAYSDTWFTVDGQQRGTLKGFPSGGASVASDGGYFELSVIFRQHDVPVQQSVRVYFDRWTSVYADGSRAGTVLAGITGEGGADVTRAGRVLEVPFYVNGGRLFAERVTVLQERSPLAP